MENKTNLKIVIGSLLVISTYFLFSGFFENKIESKISQRVLEKVSTLNENDEVLVWVQLKDKGSSVEFYLNNPELYLTERAIQRRLMRKENENLVDERDIPVNYGYIADLKNSGYIIKNTSKWFNSVSLRLNRDEIYDVAAKNYVLAVELVKTFQTDKIERPERRRTPREFDPGEKQTDNISTLNYGQSWWQSEMINVPIAHDSGYRGQGVLIACFDSGFDNLEHPTFDSVMSRGVRTYDFVNGDTIVADGPGRLGNGAHGTRVLSLIVGYTPGELISPGYWANVILAKTENTESETPIEEDNWIAAAEWADSLGADIISSSLGYLDMDPGSPWSYDWTWMSGDSCLITKGANIAAQNGIVVVNSAGNYGFNPDRNTLAAPADGFGVLTVGALNTSGNRANYSSVGLTVDGRIKPDIMAMGTSNVTAIPGAGNIGFTDNGSGTSFSCPMVSGVVAMILCANPNLNPSQVRAIIRESGSNTANPDRLIGWGTLNAWTAIQLAKGKVSVSQEFEELPTGYFLEQNFPNPFNPTTNIKFSIPENSQVKLSIIDMTGKEIGVLYNSQSQAGSYNVSFDASRLASGAYFYRLQAGNYVDTKKMVYLK